MEIADESLMVQEVEQQAMEYLQVAMTERQEVNQACVQVLQFAYASGVNACWTAFDQSTLFRDGGIFHTVHPYGLSHALHKKRYLAGKAERYPRTLAVNCREFTPCSFIQSAAVKSRRLGMAESVPDTCLASPSISITEIYGSLHHLTREDEFQEQLRATDAPFSSAAP